AQAIFLRDLRRSKAPRPDAKAARATSASAPKKQPSSALCEALPIEREIRSHGEIAAQLGEMPVIRKEKPLRRLIATRRALAEGRQRIDEARLRACRANGVALCAREAQIP